jgi:O-antigen ligase
MMVLFGGAAFIFGGGSGVVHALGRKSNLTGRTDIWAAVIPAVPNALVGAGFESFWISPSVQKFRRGLTGWWHPEVLNEAHNGYIEVYLNLGWVGVVLISILLIAGYRRAVQAYRMNSSIGTLVLAYVIASAIYSVTEAGFRMLDPMWTFLLLAVISASGVTAGLFEYPAPKKLHSLSSRRGGSLATEGLIAKTGTVFTAPRG